jgi:hypothetical protein
MPYFFILPAYAALLAGLMGAAIVSRFVPRFRPAGGYIGGGAIGTLVGFTIVNVLVWLAGLFPVWLNRNDSFPKWLAHTSQFFVAANLLIGPFIGSAVGVALGFAIGVYIVYRKRRQAASKKDCVCAGGGPHMA